MKTKTKWYPLLLLGYVLLLASLLIACACPAPPPATATIAATPSSFSFTTEVGVNPPTQPLAIQNSGEDTLDWSVTDEADWLNLSPTSGSCSSGQTDDVVISVDVTGITSGNYTATITISAPEASNSPQEVLVDLTITPVTPPIVTYGVSLAVSPESQTGLPDDTLDYTVTVTNTGTEADTYNLSISDDQGWTLTCPSATSVIAPGESENITISLTTPEDAALETEDEITIVATSQNDATVSDSATCLALVKEEQPPPPPSGVSVSISPSSTTVSPGDTFTIEVVIDSATIKVQGCHAEVSYNSTIFTAGTITEAELLGTNILIAPGSGASDGIVNYGVARILGNPAVPVSGTFISITFEVSQTAPPGSYSLDVEAIMKDEIAVNTGNVDNDGLVTVL